MTVRTPKAPSPAPPLSPRSRRTFPAKYEPSKPLNPKPDASKPKPETLHPKIFFGKGPGNVTRFLQLWQLLHRLYGSGKLVSGLHDSIMGMCRVSLTLGLGLGFRAFDSWGCRLHIELEMDRTKLPCIMPGITVHLR